MVGDLSGSANLIANLLNRAKAAGAAIIVFPVLALTGYSPEDLLLKPAFLNDARRTMLDLADIDPDLVAVVGVPWVDDGRLYNEAVPFRGEIVEIIFKHHRPTYGVFDEDRYFARGQETVRFLLGDLRVGVTICEGVWYLASSGNGRAAEWDRRGLRCARDWHSCLRPQDRVQQGAIWTFRRN